MRVVLALAIQLLAGCYATSQVAPAALQGAGTELGGPRLVEGTGSRVLLEPGTMVRARLTDGGRTGWVEAGRLRVSSEGLLLADPDPVAPGVRWQDVSALELRSLDPVTSTMAVPLFPLTMLVARFDKKSLERAMSPTEGEREGSLPALTWSDPAPRRLFTGRARRRAVIQGLATVDAQGTWGGDLAAGVSVGFRARNFYEFAVVARGMSLDGSTAGRLGALGMAMGLHADPDGDPALAFHFAVEVLAKPGDARVTASQLKWGPRFGLSRSLFLTVSPLNLSVLTLRGAGGRLDSFARVAAVLELGGTL